MTRKLINRSSAGALTAALALGTAGRAAARQIDVTPQGSSVPAGSLPHHVQARLPAGHASAHMPYYGTVLPPVVPAHMKGLPEATAAPVAAATPRAVVNQPAYRRLRPDLRPRGGAGGVFAIGAGRGVGRKPLPAARTATAARPRIAG